MRSAILEVIVRAIKRASEGGISLSFDTVHMELANAIRLVNLVNWKPRPRL